MKALDTEVTRDYIKNNSILIENCKRKHGFVGILNISCQLGGSIQLISVDIAPCIESDNLDGYIALLRPRHYDNKEVGKEFVSGLELSSSHKDWHFLKFVPPEVLCGYALVKILRSVAVTFQTEKGRVLTAEDILPSYMVKTALLWILDPEEKRSNMYKGLDIYPIVEKETCSSYKEDVFALCEQLLHPIHTPGLDSTEVDKLLLDICKKCTTGMGHLTARERILPYVLATKCSGRQQQNGINLQWMKASGNPDVQVIEHGDETTESRKIYTDSEAETVRMAQEHGKKPGGHFSHHTIAYPDISEETARKSRVWALRIVRFLPQLLKYKGETFVGRKSISIDGIRNYYLPDQEISPKDKDLAVTLCHVLEAMLE